MSEFGLRRKREIRRAEALLRDFRRRARRLQAASDSAAEQTLFSKLSSLGLVREEPRLDDVLEIRLENILGRRLQSIVHKKGLAKTSKEARLLISHGKVTINKRRIRYAGYLVPVNEEEALHVVREVKS